MKKTAIVLVMVLALAVPALAQGPFADVPTDHWAYDAVNELQQAGIVIGYPDGTFGGKRAMSRYEFAVAVARLLPYIQAGPDGVGPLPGNVVTEEELEEALAPYAKKTDIPGGPAGNFATQEQVEQIRRLVDEFRDEIAALGVDVDAMKRDVAALAARVDALEAEVERVRFTGNLNAFGIADADRGSESQPFDIDNREISVGPGGVPADNGGTLGRTINVVTDFDLNIAGRVNDSTTAQAVINYGNYLNYLHQVDDYTDVTRLAQAPIDDYQLYPYYLYVSTGFGGGALTVGRFPIQFTPYTLKKIDVDSYTSILKTDSGNYPVDGAMLANRFGGVDVTLFAVKHESNEFLLNGLTGQPRVETIYGDALDTNAMHLAGGHAVGGLVNVAQTAGGRIMFGLPWEGSFGATYYQSWSRAEFDAAANYDQARVYGADFTFPIFGNWSLAGSWTQSDTLARDGAVGVADIDDDNTAWDARLSTGWGKLGVDLGYKDIDRNFAAAGAWDKLGRWTNPVNIQGPYANFTYPISPSINFVAGGALYDIQQTVPALVAATQFFTEDDEVMSAEAGLKWGISAKNTLDVGAEWVKYEPDVAGIDSGEETYFTVGWAYQVSPNTGLKVGYQFISWDGGANNILYGADYDAAVGVVQLGVSF